MSTNNRKLKGLALAALLAAPQGVFAAYDDVGVGARTTGLGGAFTAVADDVYATYYNPAGLATLARPEFATSYSKLLSGLSDSSSLQNSFLAYAHPLSGGRKGTVGAAWNYFTLDSLYRESSLYGTYARPLFRSELPDQLFGGLSLKLLNRSLGSTSVATQPLGPTGAVISGVDPVLQNASKTNIDMDFGVLYRARPRLTYGLMIQHVLEPNVGFQGSDKLGRNFKLGAAYKTPFSTLAADLHFTKAPDASMDKILALAAEKWLPTLMHGAFGLRGSLGIGSRSYRQLALGLSYRVSRMQFDYGFALPLGGIAGTLGTHRLGLTMRFGRLREAQPSIAEAALENMGELAQAGTPEFKYQQASLELFKREAIEAYLRQAQADVAAGRFANALERLTQAASLKPDDRTILANQDRVKIVADVYPEMRDFSTDASRAVLYEGALSFLTGRDKDAVRKLSHSQSLDPKDDRIETLLRAVEAKTGVARAQPRPERVAPELSAEKLAASTMALMEVALQEHEYDKVLTLAGQVLKLDPSSALAYKRMGAAYYALKRIPEALRALRSAYKLETDSEAKNTLRSYIDALAARIEKAPSEPKLAETPAAAPRRSPQEIERLYEAGVDLYAQGRLSEAAVMFRKILDLDGHNVSARRALDRVQAEILQGEKR